MYGLNARYTYIFWFGSSPFHVIEWNDHGWHSSQSALARKKHNPEWGPSPVCRIWQKLALGFSKFFLGLQWFFAFPNFLPKKWESWWPWIYRCQLSAWIFYLCKIKWRPLRGLKGQDMQFKKQACYKIKVTELQFPSWCGSKAVDRIIPLTLWELQPVTDCKSKNSFSVYHRFDFRNMFNLFSFKKPIAADILQRKNENRK